MLQTDGGDIEADSVVIATGGLSIPKIGASDFGYRVAQQFELRMVEPRPALVPLTFDPRSGRRSSKWPASRWRWTSKPAALKGRNPTGGRFREDLLFTHRGLSGPAILQISSYWTPGTSIVINLMPELDVAAT
jgi:predicted flavoprotein YhiN